MLELCYAFYLSTGHARPTHLQLTYNHQDRLTGRNARLLLAAEFCAFRENRHGLGPEGDASTSVALPSPALGQNLSRLLVCPGYAQPLGTNKESGPHATCPWGVMLNWFRAKADISSPAVEGFSTTRFEWWPEDRMGFGPMKLGVAHIANHLPEEWWAQGYPNTGTRLARAYRRCLDRPASPRIRPTQFWTTCMPFSNRKLGLQLPHWGSTPVSVYSMSTHPIEIVGLRSHGTRSPAGRCFCAGLDYAGAA